MQNGKTKVMKLGTKSIQRRIEYELTVNFEFLNENHLVSASKDRTEIWNARIYNQFSTGKINRMVQSRDFY
jgi:hypothetical protein